MQVLSPLTPISHPLFSKYQLKVSIKRDDIIHPVISGNKWRKLKYNLIHAQQQKHSGILSFGGSFSNHIHALAFACFQEKIPVVGIIRGEKEYAKNYTLSWAKHWGMQLKFVDRKTYRQRDDADYLTHLQQQYPNYLIIPEGGSNSLALKGMNEVIEELNQQCMYDTLLCPVGSGGTLAGLIKADKNQHNIIGISVLKQQGYLEQQVEQLLNKVKEPKDKWQILSEFHRGGYAKFCQEDINRILAFNRQCNVTFEPVYSGKMILALLDLIEQGYFTPNEHIILLHTGGLQGIAGMLERNILAANDWPAYKKPSE
jgi:1-aminocyclopropane-1-carboxylate deaminase